MVNVPWPLSNNPGLKPQEGTGRLVNVFAEPRGDGSPVWRRAPGASVFARVPSSGSAAMDLDANARGATFFSTYFELVGKSTQNFSAGVNSITYPTGTADGDIVFLAVAGDDATVEHSSPTGFTALATSVAWMESRLFYKVSTGESTAQLVASTTDPTSLFCSLAFAIRGATTAPIVDTATLSTGASGDPVPPNLTATTADCLLINVSFIDDDVADLTTVAVAPTTITIAAGSTFGMGYAGLGSATTHSTGAGAAGATIVAAMRPLATTGAITASTWSLDSNDEWASISFTLRHD